MVQWELILRLWRCAPKVFRSKVSEGQQLSSGQLSSGPGKIRTKVIYIYGERNKANTVKGDWLSKLGGGGTGILQRRLGKSTSGERAGASVRLGLPQQGPDHLPQLAR